MNDSFLMHILYSWYDLPKFGPGLSLFHSPVSDEVIEHLPSVRVLHHQMQRSVSFDHFEKLN